MQPSHRRRWDTRSGPPTRHEVAAGRRRALATSDRGRCGDGRVSASSITTHSPVAACRPCCSAHALPAHPAGNGVPVTTRAPASRRSPRWRPSSRRRRRRTSLTPGALPHDASSSGPMRSASSRAGTTTLIVGTSTVVRRRGERRTPARGARTMRDERDRSRGERTHQRAHDGASPAICLDHVGDDARAHGDERQPAARVAAAADQVQARRRATVGRAHERGPATVRRRAVDRATRRSVPRLEVGRRRCVSVKASRPARSMPRSAKSIEHGGTHASRSTSAPAGTLTSRNQFSSPGGAWLGSVTELTQA